MNEAGMPEADYSLDGWLRVDACIISGSILDDGPAVRSWLDTIGVPARHHDAVIDKCKRKRDAWRFLDV